MSRVTLKRPLRFLFSAAVIWLIAGAVLNVLVAWGCRAFPIPGDWISSAGPVEGRFQWPHPSPEGWPTHADRWVQHNAVEWSAISFHGEVPIGNRMFFAIHEHRYGMPFRSLSYWMTDGPFGPEIALVGENIRTHGLWIIRSTPGHEDDDLPLLPLWPGFALNTIFYAAFAWGLWQIPGAIRRRSRRRAGKCVRCGYDLAGLAPGAACPECGTTSTPPAPSPHRPPP